MEVVLRMQRYKCWKIKTKLEGTSAVGYHKWRQGRVTNSWTTSHSIWNHETLQLLSPGWWLTDLPVCSGHVSCLIIQHLSWFLWQTPWMLYHGNLSSEWQELVPDFFFYSTALLSAWTRVAKVREWWGCVPCSACEELCAVTHLAFIKPLDLELLFKLCWQVNLKLSERQWRNVAIGGVSLGQGDSLVWEWRGCPDTMPLVFPGVALCYG